MSLAIAWHKNKAIAAGNAVAALPRREEVHNPRTSLYNASSVAISNAHPPGWERPRPTFPKSAHPKHQFAFLHGLLCTLLLKFACEL